MNKLKDAKWLAYRCIHVKEFNDYLRWIGQNTLRCVVENEVGFDEGEIPKRAHCIVDGEGFQQLIIQQNTSHGVGETSFVRRQQVLCHVNVAAQFKFARVFKPKK